VRHWDGDVKDYNYPERSTVNLELDPEGGYERRDADERHEDHERREHGLRIVRAYYGAEGQFMNVTDALRSRIDDGKLYLRVDNTTMGGDPLPGTRKWLRILYLYEGVRRNIVVDEKTWEPTTYQGISIWGHTREGQTIIEKLTQFKTAAHSLLHREDTVPALAHAGIPD